MSGEQSSVTKRQSTVCPNCSTAAVGAYCPGCGQERDIHGQTLREYLVDISYDFLSIDGKIWKGFRDLVLYPGKLTVDYLEGRRASRPVPSRLFLVMSVVVYAVIPLVMSWIWPVQEEQASLLAELINKAVPTLKALGLPTISGEQAIRLMQERATLAALISVIPLSGVLALLKRPRTAMFSGHAAHAFHLTTAMIFLGALTQAGLWGFLPAFGCSVWYLVSAYKSEDGAERRRIKQMVLWFIGAWAVSIVLLVIAIILVPDGGSISNSELTISETWVSIAAMPLLIIAVGTIYLFANSAEIFYVTRSVMVAGGLTFRKAFRHSIVITLAVLVVRVILAVASVIIPE